MQTLTAAPDCLLDLIIKEGRLDELHGLTPAQKSDLFVKLGVVRMLMQASYKSKGAIVATQARQLRKSEQAINGWLGLYKKSGCMALVDRRLVSAKSRSELPEITKGWIKDLCLRSQRGDSTKEVHRQVLDQWRLWQRTGDPQWAIPGFNVCPADCGKGYPAGFSYETIRRCQPTDYQASLARQGTISAYRSLPSILSTCVGTKYLETIFFDDEKPDVQVRVNGFEKPMVPLCFHALDRLTRYPFRPHVRLRWFDEAGETYRAFLSW